MKTRKILRSALSGVLLFGFIYFFPASQLLAQDPDTAASPPSVQMRSDFSDDELKSFVKANEKVTAIQMEGEQKMIKAIEEEGLTVNRFHELLEQQRDPQRGTDSVATAAELKSFNDAAQVILQENAKLEKQMTSSIEEQGIDIETYKQIMVAYQQNPEIQSRVNKMVEDN